MNGTERVLRAAHDVLGSLPGVAIATRGPYVTVRVHDETWVRISPTGERAVVRCRDALRLAPGRMAGIRRAVSEPGWPAWASADDRSLRRLLAEVSDRLGHVARNASLEARLLELLGGETAFRERDPAEREYWEAAGMWLASREQMQSAYQWASFFADQLRAGERLSSRELATANELADRLRRAGFSAPTTDLPKPERHPPTLPSHERNEPPRSGYRRRVATRRCIHNYPPGICRQCG